MVTINRKTGTLCGLAAAASYAALPVESREIQHYLIGIMGVTAPTIGYFFGRMNELAENAYTDLLTGAHSRRYFDKQIKTLISLSKRDNLPFGVIYVDVDGLKLINDQKGHKEGDRYIKEVADFLKYSTREHDSVCRIGGDEFVILLPNTTSYSLTNTRNRLVESIEEHNVLNSERQISVSIGCESSQTASPLEAIVESADKRMLLAKRQKHGLRI